MATITGLQRSLVSAEHAARVHAAQKALDATTRTVTIVIESGSLIFLKKNEYQLCFAKRVGLEEYNVVWQAYDLYLGRNVLSWTPQYQLFGSDVFQAGLTVQVSTNTQTVGLGQTCVLDAAGYLEPATDGGLSIAVRLENDYGPIHPGVNQVSIGIDGSQIGTPIYVAKLANEIGAVDLIPVEKVLVWFQQDIETGTMFSTARSNPAEIDLTSADQATRTYTDQGTWHNP